VLAVKGVRLSDYGGVYTRNWNYSTALSWIF